MLTTAIAPMAESVMLEVADGLTGHGLDIQSPAWDDSHYFRSTNVLGALCELVVRANGMMVWDYRPIWPCRKDPAQITSMVLEFLGLCGADGAVPPGGYLGDTLMAAVGRAARQCGLAVTETRWGAYAEVKVTNPGQSERGAAYVTADDAVRWECGYRDQAQHADALGPVEITETIARSLPSEALPD